MREYIIFIFALLLLASFVHASEYDVGGGIGIQVSVVNSTTQQDSTNPPQDEIIIDSGDNDEGDDNNHISNNNGNDYQDLTLEDEVSENTGNVEGQSFIDGNSEKNNGIICTNCLRPLIFSLSSSSVLMFLLLMLLIKYRQELVTQK